eukprot:19182-Heterococcus_DN1.PRE.10
MFQYDTFKTNAAATAVGAAAVVGIALHHSTVIAQSQLYVDHKHCMVATTATTTTVTVTTVASACHLRRAHTQRRHTHDNS